MTEHALHAAETFVRTRSPSEFAPLSLPAFRAALLLQVGKQAAQPFGGRRNGVPSPEALPESDAYVCRTFYLPSEKVGSFWFGGDWYGGPVAPAGGSRLLLRRRGEERVELLRMRGLWLGLDRPSPDDQHACALNEGDELVVGSDGAFDQLIEYAGSSDGLPELIGASLDGG